MPKQPDNWIEVKIAMSEDQHLAKAYNRSMASAATEWVLFLDHDMFFCNPHWYEIALEATKAAPPNVGWISAVTNRIGNKNQKASWPEGVEPIDPPDTEDLVPHCEYARKLYEAWGNTQLRCRGAMSGFFILTRKKAWMDAGGFDEGRKRLLGVDNVYSAHLGRAGYIYTKLPGLYFYHMYRKKKLYMRW